jgi:chromosomal replication initiator protein
LPVLKINNIHKQRHAAWPLLPAGNPAKTSMSEASVQHLSQDLWQSCVDHLAQELPEQQFNTWIRPLVVDVAPDLSKVTVLVGNRFKLDWVRAQYAGRIAPCWRKFPARASRLS